MHKAMESFDGVTHFWCSILGQPINFGYCRKANEGLPCPRVLACYETHFDVMGFIEQNYTTEERRTFLAPAPGKLERICRGLTAAQDGQDPEP